MSVSHHGNLRLHRRCPAVGPLPCAGQDFVDEVLQMKGRSVKYRQPFGHLVLVGAGWFEAKLSLNWHMQSIKKGWCKKQHLLKCFLNQKVPKESKENVVKPIAMRKTCQEIGTGSYNPVVRLQTDRNFECDI